MAAGQHITRTRARRVVTPDHIAYRINAYFIKTAGAHAKHQRLRTGLMGVREIADTQFAFFGKSRVAELSQPFVPVPDFCAGDGIGMGFIVQTGFCHPVNLAQTLCKFD